MLPTSRPRSIPAQLLYLARLRLGAPGIGLGVVLLVLLVLVLASRCAAAPVRVATFNIENYPRDDRQVRGAFAAIAALDVEAVAVQEITDPTAFARHAREALGPSWRFVANDGGPLQRVGVLYDGARLELAYAQTHDEPRVTPNGKPVLEVRLRRRGGWLGGDRALRLFVVHLKAGGEEHSPTRAEQLRQLTPIVREAARSWDE